jgi:hypothetical protein
VILEETETSAELCEKVLERNRSEGCQSRCNLNAPGNYDAGG